MIVPPQASWSTAPLSPLPSHATVQKLSDRDIDSLRARGQEALVQENQAFYSVLRDSGRRKEAASLGALGTLSAGDARFIADLLYGASDGERGGGGGTLSDRISALTLLVQSSPLHNLEALDKLFAMVRKRSRHESGPAVRAVVDWLASSGGLGGRKLRYFRDQPELPLVSSLASSENKEEKRAVNQRLVVFAFEDELKKFYLHFLRALEAQTHDALPFVRIAALGHAYHLLRDQCEQEHNVLRLLVTKLGDPDRTVAAKVSSHLLGLLSTHPAMKPIVVREVAEEMQRARGTAAVDGKEPKTNVHAQYYGVITLNQTVLTTKDAAVATALVALYFELFDSLMAQGGLEDPKPEEQEEEKKEESKDKNRWRDGKGKKKGKNGAKGKGSKVSALTVAEAHGRMLSALLAGMRRAFPFSAVPQAMLDKHVETLYKVTHTGSVTLAVQSLQLLFQLVLVKNETDKEKRRDAPVSVSLGPLTDRFYRTLYDSLLDTRLATSNKQAMYLNLLFKAIKADPEPNRAKAFIKRLSQVLSAGMDPSFICGALYLLSELVKHVPGLNAMLTDPEDGEPEHFVDARDPDDEEEEEKGAPASKPLVAHALAHQGYDGKKRDPRYAAAETTCWWDILPLTQHYHPSVAMCARQLVQGANVKSNGDLSLHTLTHFLDRFVYRNPKSKGEGIDSVIPLRGGSAMQPSVASLRLGVQSAAGVVNLRRTGLLPSEDVRSKNFAQQSEDQVAPDQAFFHRFMTTKAARQPQAAEEKAPADRVADGDDSDVDSELGLDEDEVWRAMRRTLPKELQQSGQSLDDDDDLDIYDYSDNDDGGAAADDTAIAAAEQSGTDLGAEAAEDAKSEDAESEEDEALEAGDISSVSDSDSDDMEDEDDLLPFADFDAEEAKSQLAGTKRAASDEDEPAEGLSKAQLARRERKKRKNVPTFASVDDYAHMLESDDDGNMDG